MGGVLVSVSFDGELEKNYLLLLDAKDFKEIDRAYLPINIPYPLSHGMHFPDAKWTLKISKKLIVLIYLSIFRIPFPMECIFQTRSGLYKSMLISYNILISIYVLK